MPYDVNDPLKYVPFSKDEQNRYSQPLDVSTLSEEGRKNYRNGLMSLGYIAPEDDGFFGETADATARTFTSMVRGMGSSAEVLGLGSGLREWGDKTLQQNHQWDRPEDLSVTGWLGNAVGGATGTMAAIAPAMVADALLPTKGLITASAIFSSSYGDNVKNYRMLFGEDNEAKAQAFAIIESGIDTSIEMALGTVPALGKALKGMTPAMRASLLRETAKNMSKELGKSGMRRFLTATAKNGLEEGGEEALQYMNGLLMRTLANDPENKFNMAELIDNTAQGFVGGVAMGTVPSAIDTTRNSTMKKYINAERAARKAEREAGATPDASATSSPSVDTARQDYADIDKETGYQVGETFLEGSTVPFRQMTEDERKNFANKNGWHDENTGEIVINPDNEGNIFTFGHEINHDMQMKAPELYAVVRQSMLDNATEETLAELNNNKPVRENFDTDDAFNKATKDYETFLDEWQSDRFGEILQDPKALNMTIEKAKARGIDYLQKFCDAVKFYCEKMMSYFKKNKHLPGAKKYFDSYKTVRDVVTTSLVDYRSRIQKPMETATETKTMSEKGKPVIEPVVKENLTVETPKAKTRSTITTPNNEMKVETGYAIIPIDKVITSDNPNYNKALQPRQRDSKGSKEQIAKISANINPELLLDSAISNTGAPIIDSLNQVLSGNGRTMSLRLANKANYAKYKEAIIKFAKEHGIPIPQAEKGARMILVRILDTTKMKPEDVEAFTRASNQEAILGMTAAEQAEADSKAIVANDAVSQVKTNDSGDVDLDSKVNRPFVNEFVNATNSNSLLDTEGRPTPELKTRIKRALLGCILMRKVNGKSVVKNSRDVLTNIIEAMGQDELGLKKPINGIMATAGRLLKLGNVKEQYDITGDLAQATAKILEYKKARANNEVKSIAQVGDVQELDLGKEFKKDELTPTAKMLFENLAEIRSAKLAAELLNTFADIAENTDTTTPDMFGGKLATKEELLTRAMEKINAEENTSVFKYSDKPTTIDDVKNAKNYKSRIEAVSALPDGEHTIFDKTFIKKGNEYYLDGKEGPISATKLVQDMRGGFAAIDASNIGKLGQALLSDKARLVEQWVDKAIKNRNTIDDGTIWEYVYKAVSDAERKFIENKNSKGEEAQYGDEFKKYAHQFINLQLMKKRDNDINGSEGKVSKVSLDDTTNEGETSVSDTVPDKQNLTYPEEKAKEDISKLVKQALASLPQEGRRLIRDRVFNKKTIAQISRERNIHEETLRSRYNKAISLLGKWLEEHGVSKQEAMDLLTDKRYSEKKEGSVDSAELYTKYEQAIELENSSDTGVKHSTKKTDEADTRFSEKGSRKTNKHYFGNDEGTIKAEEEYDKEYEAQSDAEARRKASELEAVLLKKHGNVAGLLDWIYKTIERTGKLPKELPADQVTDYIFTDLINRDEFADLTPKQKKVINSKIDEAITIAARLVRSRRQDLKNINTITDLRAVVQDYLERIPDDDNLQKLHDKILKKYGYDIYKLPKEIMDDPIALDKVLTEVIVGSRSWKTLGDKAKNVSDAAVEMWVNFLLSGVKTHTVNTAGNIGNAVYELGVRKLGEALINTMAKRKDAATFGEFKAIWDNVDFKNLGIADTFKRSFSQRVLSGDAYDPMKIGGYKLMENIEPAIGGKFGKYANTFTQLLKAADAVAKAVITPIEAVAYAYRKGKANGLKGDALKSYIQEQLKDTKSSAVKYGVNRAKEVLFQEDTKSERLDGQAVNWLLRAKQQGGLQGFLLNALFPFVKTPYNIVRQAVRKSPLGIVNLGYQSAQAMLGNRKIDDEFIKIASEQLIAWGFVGAMLASHNDDDDEPWITGSAEDYRTNAYKFNNQNLPPHSIKIGGKWYDYGRLEPLSGVFEAVANMSKAMKENNAKSYKKAFIQTTKGFVDKSYLNTIQEALKIASADEYTIKNIAANYVSSWIPNIVRETARNSVDYIPETKGATFWESVTTRSGFSQLYPRLDYFGREIPKDTVETTAGRYLYRLLPWTEKEGAYGDEADKLLRRYNYLNPNKPYFMGLPSQKGKLGNTDYEFTHKDYYDFVKETGEQVHDIVLQGIRRNKLNVDNPTEKDIRKIQQIVQKVRNQTRKKYVRQGKIKFTDDED